jgi:tripeptidyl-peptidase-1
LQLINQAYYNIDSTVQGSSLSKQAIYSTIQQYFSPSDLTLFQNRFQIPLQAVSDIIGGHSDDAQCVQNTNNCAEANLDLQYIMSTSKVSPTTSWYSDSDFTNFLVEVANTANLPLVFSISYGFDEGSAGSSYLNAFNTQAMKLGIRGVTIVAASGDDGANSRSVRAGMGGSCGYAPGFPASSPYVTSVGATQGVESTSAGVFNRAEITCSSNTKGIITSGGGFSNVYMRTADASFQNTVVSNYLLTVAGTAQAPVAGFNTQGRGYPDISAAGLSYLVAIGGDFYSESGTSASSPFVAGLFSNINAQRLAIGKGSLGWINPALYQTYNQFTNDITSGDNKCVLGPICCAQGFTSVAGWDPTTGI